MENKQTKTIRVTCNFYVEVPTTFTDLDAICLDLLTETVAVTDLSSNEIKGARVETYETTAVEEVDFETFESPRSIENGLDQNENI